MSLSAEQLARARELLAGNKWKLAEGQEANGDGADRITRYIPGFDATFLRLGVDYLTEYTDAGNAAASDAIADPMAGGRPQGGTWYGGRIYYRFEADQQGQPSRLRLYQVLHRGAVTLANVETDNGCRYRITASWYWNTATIEDLPAASSGVRWRRSDVLVDKETGRYTYSIERLDRLYQTEPEHTVGRSAFEVEARAEHLGVRDGDVDENGAAVTIPSTATQTDGELLEVVRRKGEDCTHDISVARKTAVAVAGAESSREIQADETVDRVGGRNLVAEPTLPESQTAGTIVTLLKRFNLFRRWDKEETTRTATARADAEQERTLQLGEQQDVVRGRNLTAEPTLPTTQTAGTVVTLGKRLNAFLRWDKVETTRTAAEVAAEESEREIAAEEKRTTVRGRHLASEPTLAETQTPGYIVTLVKRWNLFRLWDKAETTRQAIERRSAESERALEATEQVDTVRDRNLAFEPTLPSAQTPGTIKTLVKALNPFLFWNKVETTRTAVTRSAESTESEIQADEIRTTVEDRHLVAEPGVPAAQTVGAITTVRKSLNPFLRWNRQTTTRVALPQANAEVEREIRLGEQVDTVRGRNLVAEPTLPASQTAGTIVTILKQLSPFLRWNKVEVTRTAAVVAAEETEGEVTADEKRTTVRDRNLTSEPAIPATQTAGTIVTTLKRWNAFLRWDKVTVTRESVEQASAESERVIEAGEQVDTVRGRSLAVEPTLPTTQTAGIIKTLRKRLNAFGRWDKEEQTRTAEALTAEESRKEIRADETVVEVKDRNLAAEPTLPSAQTAGTIVTVLKRLNLFRRWDRVTNTRTRADMGIAIGNVVKDLEYTDAIEVLDGAANPPAALAVGEYGRVAYRKDLFGRYVGERVVRTHTPSVILPGWELSETKKRVQFWERVQRDQQIYRRMVTLDISWKQQNSAAQALAHAFDPATEDANGAAITGDAAKALMESEVGGSMWRPLGKAQYWSQKVYNRIATAAWEPDGDALPE